MSADAPPRPQVTDEPPTRPSPPRAPIGTVTLGLALVTVGVLWLVSTLGVDVPLRIVGPVLLIVLGLGVAASAVRGEDGPGIGVAVFVGVVLAAGSLVVAILDVPLAGGIGERVFTPTSVAEVEDEYRLGMGTLRVDLRDLDLGPGTTEIELSVVLGQVEVMLPDGVAAAVDARVAGGSADVLGEVEEGLGVSNERRTDGYEDASRRVLLTVRVGLGEARVREVPGDLASNG